MKSETYMVNSIVGTKLFEVADGIVISSDGNRLRKYHGKPLAELQIAVVQCGAGAVHKIKDVQIQRNQDLEEIKVQIARDIEERMNLNKR